MTKLLLTRPFPPKVVQAAQEKFDVTVRDTVDRMTEAEASDALANYDAILLTIGDAFTAKAFAAAPPRAKMLANFGVGYNHIDAEAAKSAGCLVSNTPDVVTDATADIAMTLILSTCRRAGQGERLVRSGEWIGWNPTQMLGIHVTGKTLGIIGMGRIGQAVARRGHYGFDMPVVYFNRSKKAVDMPASQVDSLHELMATADIVVVTVPGGAANAHLIDADAIAAMKPNGVFVNVARGDVVDEAALIDALQSGQIAGAGLDVYEKEPIVPAALCDMDNVVLLPHLGTAALEVREAMGMMALGNIIAWNDGTPLPQGV